MLKRIRQFDKGIARGEAAITAFVLLGMILVAFMQASLRNFSDWGWDWAQAALGHIEWADTVLQKGTLWVAFLGASLATHESRHIGIDVVPRLAGKRSKKLMRGVASFGAAVVALILAKAFWAAVLINGREVPATFQVFGENGGMVHICDATAAQISSAGISTHPLFCGLRTVLHGIGVGTPDPSDPLTAMGIGTPAAASQLIVPILFVMIGLRLLFNGTLSFVSLYTGEDLGEESSEEAAARRAAAKEAEEQAAERAKASKGEEAEENSEPEPESESDSPPEEESEPDSDEADASEEEE